MRKIKTSKKNRTTYSYYSVNGTKITLRPGENGVTEALIAMLHESDDAEFNAQRREDYHVPVHYHAYTDGDGDDAEDRNDYLADTRINPEESFIEVLTKSEHSAAFKEIWDGLQPQQRSLAIKKLQGRTNVEIAAEEGVTEAAIRNRLAKIQNKFKNLR